MTAPATIGSGYVLEAITFPIQSLVAGAPPDEEQEFTWGWDWRWIDHDRFEVGLLFHAPATSLRPEELRIAVSALFRTVGEAQTVPIESFAHGHAPALLFPYVRQVVDELTSRSPQGRVLLPPTNVLALMASFSAHDATGAHSERPSVR